MKVVLRPYQSDAFEQAREHIRQGKRRILICAPTGGGKTVLASAIMEMAREKGNRANFVVDRLSLVDQTSETFARYGLDHGVIQGEHPLYRPSAGIQVCSVQTVSRRGWPESRLDVFDEAHVLHKAHKARIEQGGTIVIGLTATPFSKGLGKYFDAVVNVTTTRKLIEQGWLAPYRIFSCAEPDMSGVKVRSTGEWDEKESSSKALEVVGDVVQEYLTHGENRKFICSAVDTAHVEELARQFVAAGINVATYTYRDSEEDRADVTREFRKPSSTIRGLITVTAASRGFDVPDVSCVIMARPLRKSLAEHIQLFGRGLRISPETGKTDCLARGTLILTDRGEVPIEQLTTDHLVWDGVNFVRHGGAVCKGIRPVIEFDGLVATPDHEVMTDDGWARFEDAARSGKRITRSGVDGCAVRVDDDHFAQLRRGEFPPEGSGELQCVRADAHGPVLQSAEATGWGQLPNSPRKDRSECPEVALPPSPRDAESMCKTECARVRELRREGDRVSIQVCECCGPLDCRAPWSSGRQADADRPCEQQRALRAWQSALGESSSKRKQHPAESANAGQSEIPIVQEAVSRGEVRGQDTYSPAAEDDIRRGVPEVFQPPVLQAKREVWDVLNAGPLQRFTANGRLVHNCLVLDHSGNAARFFQECEAFFDFGVTELDDGKPKKEPKKKERQEKEPVKCPSCRALHPPMPHCPCCGHEYPKRAAVQHVPGSLKELIAGGFHRELDRDIFPQVAAYAMERKEGDDARRMAQAIYKGITGEFARVKWEAVRPVPCSDEVRRRIRAGQIRRAYGRSKDAGGAHAV